MDKRKGKISLAILALVTFFFLPQITESFDLSVGGKAGLTFPRYIGADYNAWMADAAFEADFKFDWSAGVFLSIGVLPFLAIQPEILVSNLGGFSENPLFWHWKEYIQGFDIPILIKYRTRSDRPVIFNLFVGPDIFFKYRPIRQTFTDILGDPVTFPPYAFWDDALIRVTTFGFCAGLGLEDPLRRFFLTFDGRYNLSLVPHFTEASPYRKWYQQSFQVMFGAGYILVGKR
jgi:hypothetical protein